MIQVIVKTYDKTLSKYEFENDDLQEIIWRLETFKEESTEVEMPETLQEQSQGLKDELLNLLNSLDEALHVSKLLDWMQKRLNRNKYMVEYIDNEDCYREIVMPARDYDQAIENANAMFDKKVILNIYEVY